MTIARALTDGAVIGQVVTTWNKALDEWPGGGENSASARIRLLTRDGCYVTVPRSSVRLEELR